jgi:hypothetical protein
LAISKADNFKLNNEVKKSDAHAREQHGELAVPSLCWFGLAPVTSKFGENRNLGPHF